MSLFESASLVVTPNGTKASKLYAIKPTSGAGDLSVVRATTATRANSAGLIESVAVNVPRLDYTNSTCPSILVEPQRTNTFLYSEQLDNAYWDLFNSSVIANNSTAPDGNLTADKLLDTTSNSTHFFYKSFTLASDTTFSWFVKSAEYSKCSIENYSDGGKVVFDINNNLVVSSSGNFSNAKIESYANGFKRISATHTSTVSNKAIGLGLINNSNQDSFVGTGTSGIYVWGGQREAGSYATSYIPTTSASVTRNADVISKTGISSLIGQTEGTIFYDGFYGNNTDEVYLFLQASGSGSIENSIYLQKRPGSLISLYCWTNTIAPQVNIEGGSFTIGQRIKIAAAYKNNDFVLYVNGTQIGTDNLGNVPTCSNLNLATYGGLPTDENFIANKGSKISALWKTRLTNAELAELTTI